MIGHHRAFALALGLAFVASACAPASAPAGTASPAAAATPARPARGGTIIVAIWQEPAALGPPYTTQTIASVVRRIAVEGLTRTDNDGNYQPDLAKRIPTLQNGVRMSADGKKMDVTWELQPGTRWSDGEPVTSADVKFTWQVWSKDPNVVSRTGFSEIESIDTPDDLTAVVHYRSIYAPYPNNFFSLLPKHLLEKEADISKSDYNRRPMGTGPFRITEFVAGDHITAERNPNYREAGKPYLDRIIFKIVPSREVALAQLRVGEVQGMWSLLESQTADLERDGAIKVVVAPSPGVERIEMNLAQDKDMTDPNSVHPVLGDLAVRRALLLATPKQQIIDKLLFGKARPGSSPVSQGWAAPRDLKQEDYEPTKANSVLDQAGWSRGPDGIRSKGGVRASLVIMSTTGDQTRERIEQILVDEYKQIGIELRIQNQPSSVLLSNNWAQNDPRKRGSFDLVLYLSTPGIDPQATLERFQSRNIPSAANNGVGQNYSRFKDPEVDRAVDQAGSSLDLDQRKAAYRTAIQAINAAVPVIWLYERAAVNAYRSSVSGWQGNVWDDITWNSEDWYITP